MTLLEFRLDKLEKMQAESYADVQIMKATLGPHIAVEELKFEQLHLKVSEIAVSLAQLILDLKKDRAEVVDLKVSAAARWGPGALVATVITIVAELIKRLTVE
jgi:uncharacterized protein YPO0396